MSAETGITATEKVSSAKWSIVHSTALDTSYSTWTTPP